MLWWEEYRDWYFALMTLSTAAPWDPPKGHAHRVYSDGTRSFHDDEIDGQFGCIEEQLWAERHGLA